MSEIISLIVSTDIMDISDLIFLFLSINRHTLPHRSSYLSERESNLTKRPGPRRPGGNQLARVNLLTGNASTSQLVAGTSRLVLCQPAERGQTAPARPDCPCLHRQPQGRPKTRTLTRRLQPRTRLLGGTRTQALD